MQIGDHERLAQRLVAGAVLGHAALQPVERVVAAVGRGELVGDADVARRSRRSRASSRTRRSMSPSARASDSLIARSVSPACESAARESGGMLVELARQDRVERGETVVAEQVAVALGRVVHPVALGLLGQLDEPGGERLGLGRHGVAGGQVQLAHLFAQRVHVGVGRR